MTNQLLLSNAQKLKQTTVDIRRESERGIADTYLRKAQENLDALTAGLPASPYGEILTSFIGYVRNRDA